MLAGVGGGRILTLTAIIITDLVPLAERGKYQGLIGGVWCPASDHRLAEHPHLMEGRPQSATRRYCFFLGHCLSLR
ncbi:hypothetical protein DFH09DRAFT_173368 [Mycena vulgaris]|nr:hypothetical protein DFH09DRAFT_173368 [Mycena vulgaris]